MTSFENPFFTREIRQLARRPRAVQIAMLACLGWMALVVVGGGIVKASRPALFSGYLSDYDLLGLLDIPHLLLCCIAAGYGGYRIFYAEQLRGTLDSTFLFPMSAARWVSLKLMFPLMTVLLAWLCVVPLYILAAALDLESIGNLEIATEKPLLCASGMLFAALLYTPRAIGQMQKMRTGGGLSIKKFDPAMWQVNLLSGLIYGYSWIALTVGGGLTSKPLPFYHGATRETTVWIVALVCIGGAGWFTGQTVTEGRPGAASRATVAQTVAVAVLYYGGAGLIWHIYPSWADWLAVAGLPLFVLLLYIYHARRRENSAAPREIAWLQQRYANPIFIRDMRVYTRHASIRQCVAITFGALAIGAVLGVAGIQKYGVASFSAAGVGAGLVYICILVLMQFGARPRMFWAREWTSQTLPSLLLTPQTSTELISGRLFAGCVYQGFGLMPLFVVTLGFLLAATATPYWGIATLALSLAPVPISFAIGTGCMVRFKVVLSLRGSPIVWLLRLAQVTSILLAGALAVLELWATIPPGPPPFTLTPLEGWCCAVVLCIANSALAVAWFRLKVKQLEDYRSGDIELPDSTVVNRQWGVRAAIG